ncbi:glycosyltransferase [Dietzia kunjamensis]|uniref:glycosyltransferase family 2 protein n=1 Tax=Dietzia kunjamensis TaxID=322509 RepID=UPI0024BAA31E|nr:glycosyltransferase [Dietzia kunjamensis]MDJ0422206.1 glycosyltransferase [Dietzia kunjamensis]
MNTNVTVVVASRNRREDLRATLPCHDAPVIVVDNASDDDSVQVCRAAGDHVRVIASPENLAARARTVGARAARTEIVAFADDDSWWEPGSLERAVRLFAEYPRLGLAAGTILVGPGDEPDPINAVLADSPLGTAPDAPGPGLLGFVGCGAIVRREAFLGVGGFDDVIRFPGEEERVALDLHDAGWQICHVPELVAHHHPSPVRDSPGIRRAGLTRSRVLTALLRLPAGAVAGEVVDGMRTADGRRGLLGAVPRVRAALAGRRVVGERTVAARDRLRAADDEERRDA